MGNRTPVDLTTCIAKPKAGRLTADLGEVADLRQLRLFHSLAQTGSFTATACAMEVTQSAVSHSIKALERSLGMPLFFRQGRQTSLTPEGQTLLVSATEILRELGRASQRLSQLRSGELSTLRFGSADTVSEFLLPQMLASIGHDFPDANVILRIGDAEELLHLLNEGTIDVMLGIGNEQAKFSNNLQSAPLFSDQLGLITSAHHAWHDKVAPLKIDDLKGERILLFGRQSESNRVARNWLHSCGVQDVRLVDVRTFGTLSNLVRVDFGIGLAPKWVVEMGGADLSYFEIPGHALAREWNLTMRKTHTFSKLERRFLDLLTQATSALEKR